jgi:hypothetical protein
MTYPGDRPFAASRRRDFGEAADVRGRDRADFSHAARLGRLSPDITARSSLIAARSCSFRNAISYPQPSHASLEYSRNHLSGLWCSVPQCTQITLTWTFSDDALRIEKTIPSG